MVCLSKYPTMEVDDHGNLLSSSGWGDLHLRLFSIKIQTLKLSIVDSCTQRLVVCGAVRYFKPTGNQPKGTTEYPC